VNTTSASPAETIVSAPTAKRVLVWDAPVRVFHWLTVACFAGAWITAESERWRLLHATLGYTMAGLLVFRLVWGFVGSRHARFADFVRGPRAVLRYLGSLLRGQPEHHVGHNPAGALAIIGLLLLIALASVTGWAAYNEVGGEWVEGLHEGAANAMMALVVVHVGAVALSSWLHHENLVGAMITGRKPGTPRDAIAHAWRSVAALMLAAVLAFWWWQWQAPIGGAPADDRSAATTQRHLPQRDDD
jgi:cytochrome b